MYKDSREWMAKFQDRMQQAKRYVKFCVDIYNHQRSQGRFLLHEHPWLATSRALDCVEKIMAQDDVRRVQTHLCQFGMMSRIGGVGSELGPVPFSSTISGGQPPVAWAQAMLSDMNQLGVIA